MSRNDTEDSVNQLLFDDTILIVALHLTLSSTILVHNTYRARQVNLGNETFQTC